MKALSIKLKTALAAFWNVPLVSRALHTFWQSFLAVFTLGITGVLSAHSVPTIEDAAMALIVASVAAGLSAVKTMAIAYVQGLRA